VKLDGTRLAPPRDKEDFTVKKTVSVLTATFVALALAATASAQTRPSADPAAPKSTRSEPQRQAWSPQAGAVESGKIVGMKVKNSQGKDVGEINQLIVDPSSGKISHVVLGKGGVLGVGEQRLVLEWSDLKMQADPDNRTRMVAMVDQAKVDSAPRYEARRDTAPAASPTTSPGTTTTQPKRN
jgi:sporulation protein YlmC with PRC-barrel domain